MSHYEIPAFHRLNCSDTDLTIKFDLIDNVLWAGGRRLVQANLHQSAAEFHEAGYRQEAEDLELAKFLRMVQKKPRIKAGPPCSLPAWRQKTIPALPATRYGQTRFNGYDRSISTRWDKGTKKSQLE